MNMFSYEIRNWSSQVAQLYSVAEASKNETGGGEGVEVKFECKVCKPDICEHIFEAKNYNKKRLIRDIS